MAVSSTRNHPINSRSLLRTHPHQKSRRAKPFTRPNSFKSHCSCSNLKFPPLHSQSPTPSEATNPNRSYWASRSPISRTLRPAPSSRSHRSREKDPSPPENGDLSVPLNEVVVRADVLAGRPQLFIRRLRRFPPPPHSIVHSAIVHWSIAPSFTCHHLPGL